MVWDEQGAAQLLGQQLKAHGGQQACEVLSRPAQRDNFAEQV